MIKHEVPPSSRLEIKNIKDKNVKNICLNNILHLLFRKVQVVTVKNLFIIIYTFFTLYFFNFVCFVKYLLGLCSIFLNIIVVHLYLLLVFLLQFFSFSKSMSLSCNCFLFRQSVCFCREQAFLMLFTRIELTGVQLLSCLLKSQMLREELEFRH